VPGYSIVKVTGEDGRRGLRVGDVTFVPIVERNMAVDGKQRRATHL